LTEDKEQADAEDEFREYLQGFLKWFKGGGTARHVGITALAIGMAAPFLLGLTMIVVVVVWILPVANAFTDRLAVFGVLFTLLTALSLQLARGSERMMFGLYILRRRRKQKPTDLSPEESRKWK
jgi:hypothetical protein